MASDPNATAIAGLDMAARHSRPLPTDQATADYMELLNRAEVEPLTAQAHQEFLKLGLPVIVCNDVAGVTEGTRRLGFKHEIDKALMEILVAARIRAAERKYREGDGVKRVDAHA